MKKILSHILLAACGILLFLTLGPMETEAFDGSGSEYDWNYGPLCNFDESDTVWILGYNGSDSKVKVPSEIGGYKVVGINNYAFSGNNNITSVTIPKGITEIGESAFDNCVNLKSVTIPNSVTTIGSYAFRLCAKLTNVKLPTKLTEIADGTFESCAITSITIPEKVKKIGNCAFQNCTELKKVSISKGVTSIGSYAFSYCVNLKSVTIPNGVKTIGAAFCASGIENITIPSSVSEIHDACFEDGTGDYYLTVTIKCKKGSYAETYAINHSLKYEYLKSAAKIKVKTTSKTYKASDLKSKTKSFSIGASVTGKGKLSYQKLSGSGKLKINKTTGKITVSKKTKKGVYKIKVKVSAKASKLYKAASETVTITVKVK